jgi:hypothetical protein
MNSGFSFVTFVPFVFEKVFPSKTVEPKNIVRVMSKVVYRSGFPKRIASTTFKIASLTTFACSG